MWWKIFMKINFLFKSPGDSVFYCDWQADSAVVPYKFSLWKLSPSFCPSLSWQQIFISIKLSHSFASKLVDKLHSYKVTQDKLNGSKSHVTCDGDSRSRETCGHTEAPPLLPLLPPSLHCDLPLLLVTSRFGCAVSHGHAVLLEAGQVTCWTN